LDGESSDEGAVVAGLAASWAATARGKTAAAARARTQLTDFETREYMRFSSATDLNGKWITAVLSSLNSAQTNSAPHNARIKLGAYSIIKNTIGEFLQNIFFNNMQYSFVQHYRFWMQLLT
jgi:hypothetical protein